MRKLLIPTCLLVLGAAGGAGGFWFSMRPLQSAEPPGPVADAHEPVAAAEPPTLSRTPDGETLIRLDTQTQQRVGLKVESLLAATRQAEVAAYGLLQEDPAQAFTLRAPVAGVLRTVQTSPWPDLNQRLAAGILVGFVEPRLTQVEQIDLAARLTQARADAAEAEGALAAARASYENKKKLNSADKAVSDRALEEARAKVQSEEARLNAARQIVELITLGQSATGTAAARFELRTEQAGEIIETSARPGEAVEAGQILLRIARFDTLVARVEVPVGQAFDPAAASAQIVPVGQEECVLVGERIGLWAGTNSTPHGPTLLFRVPTAGLALRPGAAVIAHVPIPGGVRGGVLVLRSAVIRLAGKPWVYVQAGKESFARRELTDAEPTPEGWFATRGFEPGDHVVSDGAQMLLSEELKAQIEREAAATE